MVLMPHWIVCFWTGSGPDLEKFDLGTEEGGSAACHNYPPGPFTSTLGGGERELVSPGALTLTLANQECHRKRRIQLAKPLSAHQHHCMTWEDSQTFFSQEIRFLA